MVGGFIEHQDLVVCHESAREGDPSSLPSGKARNGGLGRKVWNQARHDVAHSRIARPLVGVRVSHDHLEDGRAVCKLIALVDDADPHPAGASDATGVRSLEPGEAASESRLSSAICADDADAIAVFEAESDSVENGSGAIVDSDAFSSDQVCH
jgi:hypothetical protein